MKILVCGPSWVGDMVMAQSLFITLKKRFPDGIVDVLAPSWSLSLLSRMPEINRAIELPIDHGELGLKKRFKIGRQLSESKYDWAIITPRSVKPALVPFFARIPIRTGYKGEARYILINDPRKLDKTRLTMTVQRQVALGCPKDAEQPPNSIPPPVLRIDTTNRQRVVDDLNLDLNRPIVTFFPGAEYGPAKQWPLEYFRTLALKLVASGYQVWILGGPQDKSYGSVIAGENDLYIFNLIGQTSMGDAIDLISLSKIAVTNDSGLMHVAAAVGVHVVVIYGATSPDYTPPLTDRKTTHYLALDCAPCFKRECPFGHLNCLKKITPADIMESINSSIGRQ